jgi:hypothetical protein
MKCDENIHHCKQKLTSPVVSELPNLQTGELKKGRETKMSNGQRTIFQWNQRPVLQVSSSR